MTTERKGELFTIAGGVLWAFFPIITILSLKIIPRDNLNFNRKTNMLK